MKRRKFVKNTLVGGAAMAASPLILNANSGWKGANDRVRVAVIGIRGMGQNHISSYMELSNVEVAAICDVDENLFEGTVKRHFTSKGIKAPKTYIDMRELFENKDIDAVSVVTPNHWHALAAIWAIQAGKHVSVEKPCCHNIFEGQKLIEAANKYNVIVQDGAEQRSYTGAQLAAEFLSCGKLGQVYMAKGICYKWRDTISKYPDGPMPDNATKPVINGIPLFTKKYISKVNYDLWLGPAPKREFNPNRFHYNWHWNFDYGNGDIGNQGVHEMDVARWGLGVKLPTKVIAVGGHIMFDDAQNTPNVLMAVFEFPDNSGKNEKKKILQFEVRHWISNREGWIGKDNTSNTYMTSSANTVGNLFYGSEGYMAKNASKWQTYLGKKREFGPSGEGMGNHYQNFINTIRSNDKSMLNGKIEGGVYSSILVHLANISYRLGRSLEFDPDKIRFKNDDEANSMIKRKYRKPFVVPDEV